jgi:DNA invertase Pin-like site-specific DNA recombinase
MRNEGADRPALAKALKAVAGDVLLVTRLDRLARSTRDLLNIVHAIGERGASFKGVKHLCERTCIALMCCLNSASTLLSHFRPRR